MAISTIRKFTTEDAQRIESAAKRFCLARGISKNEVVRGDRLCDDYTSAVDEHIWCCRPGDPDIRAWRKAFARALRMTPSADLTVGYGYVGIRCN